MLTARSGTCIKCFMQVPERIFEKRRKKKKEERKGGKKEREKGGREEEKREDSIITSKHMTSMDIDTM